MINANVSFREVEIGRIHVGSSGALEQGGVKAWEIVVEIGGESIVIGHGDGLAIDMGQVAFKEVGTSREAAFLAALERPSRSVTMKAELYPEAIAAIERAAIVEAGR